MDLAGKGSQAFVGTTFKMLAVVMAWSIAADFDLMAVVAKKDGTKDLVYFGKKGDLNQFPFIMLDKDAGVGDTAGQNKETLRISKFDDSVAQVHLIVLDYGAVQNGAPARFANSDCRLMMSDDVGTAYNVKLDCGESGNICLIATVDLTGMMGAQMTNVSRAGIMKGFKKLEDVCIALQIA